ncbi:MAG: hypothetical protein KAI95_13450, partial [Bacteroidales bacterium]|nr:hypothetical protein [Bacteroidales bacterium]
NLSMSLFGEPFFWAGLSVLFLAGALLSGLYPAFVLSSFKAVEVVKGKFSSSGHGYVLRGPGVGILTLLSREFIELILLAILIATPLTWWVIAKWLENYPYQAGISWPVFIFTGLLVIVFALLAVGIQTVHAANINPAQSLKYE